MSRFRMPLIILGAVGFLVVAGVVIVYVRASIGTPEVVPIAKRDIPAGTQLDHSDFDLLEVRGLDTSAYVMRDEFRAVYEGYPLLQPVLAGLPVLKAQVNVTDTLRYEDRLTLLLSEDEDAADHLVFPLPVTADQVGNFVATGDYVDVIFTLGRPAATEIQHGEKIEPPAPVSPTHVSTPTYRYGEIVTTTLTMPIVKVILPDVPVMRVEREQVRAASASYGTGAEAQEETVVEGDVVRLYLELDREQAEVLSFALNNGTLNLPARAEPAGGASEGFAWEDFVDLFFADRPEEELRGER